jgi:hypothetical protein
MSAAGVDGASTREGDETAGGVPRRTGTQRYWVIAKDVKDVKDGFGRPDLLTVDLDGTGQALPIFNFEEEARMSEGSCSICCRRLGPACRSASWAWTETTSWSR